MYLENSIAFKVFTDDSSKNVVYSYQIYDFDSQTGEFRHFEVEVDGEVKYMMKNDKKQ